MLSEAKNQHDTGKPQHRSGDVNEEGEGSPGGKGDGVEGTGR